MTKDELVARLDLITEDFSGNMSIGVRSSLHSLICLIEREGIEPSPEPSVDRRFSEVNEQVEALTQQMETCFKRVDKRLALVDAALAKLRSI